MASDDKSPRDGSRFGRGPALTKGLLFLSLALNLLVAGLVAGALLKGEPKKNARHHDRSGGPLTLALDGEERRAIGREIGRQTRPDRPSMDEVRAEYDAVLQALRATPYRPDAVRQSLENQTDFVVRRQQAATAALLNHIDAMTEAERMAYAQRLEEGLRRFEERLDRKMNRKPEAAATE
ncbi:periplasmic heavy metal sensor [Pseudooceanicola aestuarii]|uniref:periplasmic heavy metal sensor n=1 Tax=Pseudooceanicola aestuarii TaxID=2697319 RepID=UPI0013CFD5ED|nr:periplasmic heavy metal sensor [Pseudooceanicola aestuarii]